MGEQTAGRNPVSLEMGDNNYTSALASPPSKVWKCTFLLDEQPF